jgi:hypothetical protein
LFLSTMEPPKAQISQCVQPLSPVAYPVPATAARDAGPARGSLLPGAG